MENKSRGLTVEEITERAQEENSQVGILVSPIWSARVPLEGDTPDWCLLCKARVAISTDSQNLLTYGVMIVCSGCAVGVMEYLREKGVDIEQRYAHEVNESG